jgi:outer membrane lipopolysaccharide assembly protein LptE/RlpB
LIRELAVTAAFLVLAGCGYHISGQADALPDRVRTIAVPAFNNITTRYKLTDRLPAAITREFLTRTRYRVVPDDRNADAILRGTVINFLSFPNVVDQATGRATGVQVIVSLQLTLTERESGKVLYSRPNMEVRERYEIAVDPNAYFEESDVAVERLSHNVARSVVSAVLEAF